MAAHNFKSISQIAVFCGLGILTACGGGGNTSTTANRTTVTTTTPTPVVTGPTWTAGTFAAESSFKNRCAFPRSGIDPATGNAYPDVSGSTLYENHWIRSWSNNTYLWYNELPDLDPATYSDRLAYFDTQKTTATTASGTPVDQFHFTLDTADYQQRVSSGSSAGYGMELALIVSAPPRDIRIAFTEPGSPATAASANLTRGVKFLEADGVDVVNGSDTDTLNAAFFPSAAGESHTFLVQDIGSTATRTVTMTSATVTSQPVNETQIIPTTSGDVGYILFNTFGTSIAEEQIVDAMTDMSTAGVTDLVIDLRYNGGGFLAISAQLGYMIAGASATNGRTFDSLTFNSKHPTINPVTGAALSPTPFYNTGLGFTVPEGQVLPNLGLNRVFILSTDGTCSASEALINGLRGINVDVILIGNRTCGKPYGFYATDNCGETYFTVQFRGENDIGFGDYSDGFTPANSGASLGESVTGCLINDDFGNALGDSNEALLSAALEYRDTGLCPTPPAASPKPSAKSLATSSKALPEGDLLKDPRVRQRLILENSRLNNLPTQSGN